MKKKILIIDDELDLVNLVKMRLEFNNYAVIPLYTSKRAMEIAKREEPDLILLDIRMPDADGYEVCRLLKCDAKTKKIPIILFTSQGVEMGKMSKEYKNIGAADFVLKPFDPVNLLEKVRALIGE